MLPQAKPAEVLEALHLDARNHARPAVRFDDALTQLSRTPCFRPVSSVGPQQLTAGTAGVIIRWLRRHMTTHAAATARTATRGSPARPRLTSTKLELLGSFQCRRS
ncbi:hypothetical protein ASE41_09895 [Streptomyces sp. Root264]|nr:hypothetical protein ASE41_09895 [Streptomyces sp. Root264]